MSFIKKYKYMFQKIRRDKRYKKKFLSVEGISINYGVYKDKETASNYMKQYINDIGCETVATKFNPSSEYKFVINKIFDYPVLYWMQKILKNVSKILDFGGGIGQHFYAYKDYLDFSPSLKWSVMEIPTIVEVANQVRKFKNENQINFISEMDSIDNADILLATGSLQYVDDELLNELFNKNYKHILLNRLPLGESEDFITVQNVGTGAFAYHFMRNKENFINKLNLKGYTLIDEWTELYDGLAINPEVREKIGSSVKYYGFYFKKSEEN